MVKKRQVLWSDNVPLKVDLLSVRKVSGEWNGQNGTDEDDENFESEDQLEHNLGKYNIDVCHISTNVGLLGLH